VPLPRAHILCCVFVCASLPLLPAVPSKPSPAANVPSTMQSLIERYSADSDTLESVYTDPFAPAARERTARFLADTRRQLAQVDFAALDQEGKADYLLLANHLTREEHRMTLAAKLWTEVEPLLPFAPTVFALEDAKRRVEIPNGEKIAGQLNTMTAALALQRKELEARLAKDSATAAARPTPITAWRAANDVDRFREHLHQWCDFYNGYDPTFTWWAAQPYKAADDAMKDYATFLRER